jgi:hypothetical protein
VIRIFVDAQKERHVSADYIASMRNYFCSCNRNCWGNGRSGNKVRVNGRSRSHIKSPDYPILNLLAGWGRKAPLEILQFWLVAGDAEIVPHRNFSFFSFWVRRTIAQRFAQRGKSLLESKGPSAIYKRKRRGRSRENTSHSPFDNIIIIPLHHCCIAITNHPQQSLKGLIAETSLETPYILLFAI